MYSDVLDELERYDSSYNTQDNLPRVYFLISETWGGGAFADQIDSYFKWLSVLRNLLFNIKYGHIGLFQGPDSLW